MLARVSSVRVLFADESVCLSPSNWGLIKVCLVPLLWPGDLETWK